MAGSICIAASSQSAPRQPKAAISAAVRGMKIVPQNPVMKVMAVITRMGCFASATTTDMAGPQSAVACAMPSPIQSR